MKISQFVKNKRAEDGLTVREFGDKYGISRNLVCVYESEKYDTPTTLQSKKFCKTFGINYDYYLTNFENLSDSTKNALTYASQFIQNIKYDLSSDYSIKVVENFYNQYSKKFKLKDFELNKIETPDKNYPNIYIEHQASCKINKNNVFLSSFLHPMNFQNRSKSVNFSHIGKAISDISCYSKNELNSKYFIVFVSSDEAYNFYIKRTYNESANSLYLVLVEGTNKFTNPVLLFGNDFLKTK